MRSVSIVIESLGGGGAQNVVSAVANAWCKAGRIVHVITFSAPDSDRFALDPAIHRTVIGGVGEAKSLLQAILANIRRLVRLRKAIKATGTEVVLGMVGTTNILSVLAARGLGRRIIISERNDPRRQSLGKIWDMLRRLLYRRADLVVANSRNALAGLEEYVPAQKLRWLPNPLRAAGTASAVPVEPPLILAVGRLHHQKGFDVLLRAFEILLRRYPDWTLVILGEGDERRGLQHLAEQLCIARQVRFPGYVAEPFGWYNAATLFVQPSRFEGLPNTVLEAMSCGLPCVVTDAQPGILEFLTDRQSGIVVPVESSDALAAAMEELIENKTMRETLGQNARLAVAGCRADNVVRMWSELVDDA
jgi:GalNAc-alpha-(1->4)-GalNAc-alpha-(1->3)-diNAcBac-PP-undecaprenol alpha-1,4-N-acetyl-D-galactosaminyltransferase